MTVESGEDEGKTGRKMCLRAAICYGLKIFFCRKAWFKKKIVILQKIGNHAHDGAERKTEKRFAQGRNPA
jgi:hypothetical protein